ncbi:O-linked N-acetylglucosamine transferase, SPINDLY family protein [Trichlorobacter ammonificans]|uniref:protein O-GlcNAc transferase n=1 Tax=Trichlorobacter ammonificans TaxID=2916410 RepID=A0ABM9DDX8_9BACT|nr:tetratricopeptide repeat protein [Trichlorobacter ammonificans]CAH2032604.1 Tetratricopeptide TPR_2 repeat protein [Trichlorobacter ammonificans]
MPHTEAEQSLFYINRMLDLAASHLAAARTTIARDLCRKVLELHPGNFEASYLLARAAAKDNDHAAAAELIRAVVTPHTRDPALLREFADYHRKSGEHTQALTYFKTLAAQHPDSYDAWYHLAELWLDVGNSEGLQQALQHAGRLGDGRHSACYDLAALYERADLVSLAEQFLHNALHMAPNNTYYLGALANLLKRIGKADDAATYYSRLATDLPASDVNHQTHTNHLMNYICTTAFSPEAIYEHHLHWGKQCCRSVTVSSAPSRRTRQPERPLNIGYVSADFCRHPVAFFIEPLLSTHDQNHFKIFLYANLEYEDDVTAQIRQRPCSWRNIFGISDDEACRMIEADGIDILVDLGGLTRKNRLPIFARQPAPVQVTWLGYAHSTGLPTVDYRFTDAVADPPGMTEHLHTEQLYRLPDCFLGYHPPLDPPDISPLPHGANGYVTFVAFNNLAKTNDRLLGWWAEILKQVPDARLMLKDSSFTKDYRFREVWLDRFAALGVTADRICLLGRSATVHDHLRLLGTGDIALDTYPYNGTTTTCETLFMGTPVVTLAGPSHVARVSASILTCVGAPELIARTPEEYIAHAVSLATDTSRLQYYRTNLRHMMQKSPLMDFDGFARKIEIAYRDIWRRWCHTVEEREPA